MLRPHNDTSTLPRRAAKYVTRNSTNDEQNIIININYNLSNYSLITVNSAVTTEVATSP